MDYNILRTPWVESPFFDQILKSKELDIHEFAMALQYNTYGYIVLDLDDVDFDGIKRDISERVSSGDFRSQEEGYHYSDSPRVFEAWRWSKPVLELARHPKILKTLEFLYEKNPIPFQTINFLKGSNQPLYSDTIHFCTSPDHWMVGVWVALEDMDEDNGTLCYVPGSHKLPVYNLQSIGLPIQEYGKQFEAYRVYEEFIAELIKSQGTGVEKFKCKKGQALVWASNLIHGGSPILDSSRTRWSQAIHYYFPGCDHYYSPLFSDIPRGIWSDKNLEGKDILNHTIEDK